MATRPISNVINVWNQNTTYTGIGLNITDTQSGTNSKLLNLQINSGSKFYVDKNGNVVATGNISSSKFTASYARIGGVPSTSQYKFGDNSLPDLYSNKIRGYSGSFTYLEIISGSAPRAILPVIENVTNIKGDWDGVGVSEEHITFSTTGNDNKPRINIVADSGAGDGTINVNAVDLNLGGVINKTINFGRTWNSGPNNGRQPIEISGSHISFNPGDPNDCIDINGCLNISGNLNIGGNFKIGPNSLYLSSSATESRIHGTNLNISSSVISASRMYVSRINGTNLNISSSVISASRMHVGGKTNTTQYKFYDGSKPDLYVNKLRAYSGSFTSLEIISGSEGSMSIKDNTGKNVFSARASDSYVKMGEQFLDFLGDNKKVIFGGAGTQGNAPRSTFEFNGTDVIYNNTISGACTISGSISVKGDTMVWLRAITGSGVGTIKILSGSNTIRYNNVTMSFVRIKNDYKDLKINVTSSVYSVTGSITKLVGTHTLSLADGALKIDGTNSPPIIFTKGGPNVARMLVEMSSNIIKFGTQSLYITGSTISGSELNLYFPDNKSKLNVYHITGSSGKYNKLTATNIFGMVTGSISGSKGTFNSFNFNAITASSRITSSTVGSSSGKYAKIQIGNQTYKILLYEN